MGLANAYSSAEALSGVYEHGIAGPLMFVYVYILLVCLNSCMTCNWYG